MGNSPNPKQYTKYSKNTAEVRVKKCIPIQRGMFRLGRGNLFYLILIKIFTILNNIVNNQCTDIMRLVANYSKDDRWLIDRDACGQRNAKRASSIAGQG